MKTLKKIFLILFTFVYTALAAEQLSSPTYGYSIDLPEEYELSEKSKDGKSYLFTYKKLSVNTILKIYDAGRFSTPSQALTESLNNLNADGDCEPFWWRNQETGIAVFTITLNRMQYSGFGAAFTLPENKGILVAFDYCPSEKAEELNGFLVSILDSICIDTGSYFESGVMTSYIYPESNRKIVITKEIDGKKIKTQIDSNDSEASNYVIDREYGILLCYQSSPKWKEAWQRYYRMIIKDSYKRLQRPAFDIYNVLAPECKDDTDLAQKLLTWTQGFSYVRAQEKTESDFTSLPDILLDKGSDCDSRSMLISILLQHMNIDCVFFISAEYSHAMAGLISDHPGQTFTANGKKYLTGETTAKNVTWGMISQEMCDRSKWIPVVYP